MPGIWQTVGIVVALNVLAFVLFAIDKGLAASRNRRISERTLLLAALLFAAPGAWAAMSVFRHKTRKRSFQVQMAAVTLIQAVVLVLLLVRA